MIKALLILLSPFWVPLLVLLVTLILLVVAALIFVVAVVLLFALIWLAKNLMHFNMWLVQLRNDFAKDIAAQVSAEQERSTWWRFGRVFLRRVWRNLHAEI